MSVLSAIGLLVYIAAGAVLLSSETVFQEILAALLAILGTLFLVCSSLEGIHTTLKKRKPTGERELQQIAADLDWFRELKAKELHEARERMARKNI